MNRTELVKEVADKVDLAVSRTEHILVTILETITKALSKGSHVALTGFGTFKVKKRAARKGRNPKTGEAIKTPARKVPRFTAGTQLKGEVSGMKSKKVVAKKVGKKPGKKVGKKGKK